MFFFSNIYQYHLEMRSCVGFKLKLIFNIDIHGLLEYKNKMRLLSQRNQKIYAFMHRCGCKIMKFGTKWELTVQIKENFENWKFIGISKTEIITNSYKMSAYERKPKFFLSFLASRCILRI